MDDQIDLGVELYKRFGLEGLKGHPAFDPLIEASAARKCREPRWQHKDDCGHYKSVTKKLDTTNPVTILVVCPSRFYVDCFRGYLAADYEWDRVHRDTLSTKRGTRIFFASDPPSQTRGLRVDYLAPHRDVSWRTFEALAPYADSVIRY